MKKALLACAISMALLNVVGCSDQNTETQNQDSLAQAQNASAQFVVNFPEAEVQASLISDDAQSIKLRMVSMSALVAAIESCKEEGWWPNYCLQDTEEIIDQPQASSNHYHGLLPETEELQSLINKYASISSEELESKNTLYFSRQMAQMLKPLLDTGAIAELDFGSALIERDLTRQANSATISNLLTGLYVIVAEQQDDLDKRISYEMMSAYLGEGENPITLNMMSGSWQVVNSANQASPITFNLLSSTLAADWDWDPLAEGNQHVIEAASEGDTTSAALAAIHYWNHGETATSEEAWLTNESRFDPVNFIFDMRLDDNSIDSVRAYDDYDQFYQYPQAQMQSENNIASQMNGFFHQMYDARLTDNKTLQGGMYNFDVELFSDAVFDSRAYQEAGAIILDDGIPTLITNNDGNGNRLYEMNDHDEDFDQYDGTRSYRDANGQMQTLYFVTKYNAESSWKSPNTDADLSVITNMTVTGGNQIDGYLIEYISQGTGHDINATSTTLLSENRPQSHALMALAMSQVQQSNGLTASASAHPMGNQCASIEEAFIYYDATYAWVDEQWQAGMINPTYQVNQTESAWEVTGSDLNGNGLVEIFETGVIENWGIPVEYCQNCGDIGLYNRIESREEGGVSVSYPMAYAYISDTELAEWTPVLDETQTPIPYQYEKDGVKIGISYQQYHASDLDDDGTVEYFENVGGKTDIEYMDMHVCYQPIRLRGGAQEKVLDDFLYETDDSDATVTVSVTITTTAYTQGDLITANGGAASMQCDMNETKQVGDTETFSEIWSRTDETITAYEQDDLEDQWTMPINLSTSTIDLNDTYVEEDPTGQFGDIFTSAEVSSGSLVWNAETEAFEGTIREISTLSWTINDSTSVCDETMDVSVEIISGSSSAFLGN